MDTKALEKFCPWARVELIDAVHLRCVRYALDDAGRAALFERIERMDEERGGKGYAAFCEQQAYSWFNRFAAIRFMELHGYLSNNVRMLSAGSGAFEPECLRMASELDLPGLELAEVLDLITAGDDEALFRRILVAQMNELADCLPTVFGHVDDADALTLPDNLLAHGEHDVLFHLVADIPEEAWGDVEVLGWMYQFYNSELKDAFFKSKLKAAVEDLAPATQLFTPDWIVRYMVENSLGRLWMLNNPGSHLREDMAYYIEPDAEHEDFIHIEGPEDITFCDPACGSGHILVYAFSLLFKMYSERGYRERDVPRLILEKNLSGMEIDERAAQIASLVLAMCAREHDRRFFTRGVTADICVLGSVDIDVDALDPASELRRRPELIEALAHLDEVGSLLAPSPEDLGGLKGELMRGLSGDLFVSHTQEGIERAAELCEALSRTFDVVVANPPYMGSSSFNPFMSKWMKANYPDSCKDLCTAFIERGLSISAEQGYCSMVTAQSWMFLSSFQHLRERVINESVLITLSDTKSTGYHSDNFTANCAFCIFNGDEDENWGSYFQLSQAISEKPGALIEAIQNPDCGWFYRADASTFHDIPGSPIAYWASDSFRRAFNNGDVLGNVCTTRQGTATRDNNKWLRDWWEIPRSAMTVNCKSPEDAQRAIQKWFPYNKGGQFRKWYGNAQHVINWFDATRRPQSDFTVKKNDLYFKQTITWGLISSSVISFRHQPEGSLFDVAGMSMACEDADQLLQVLAFCNSSISQSVLQMIAPTLNYQIGDIMRLPIIAPNDSSIVRAVKECEKISQADWDTQETSWDFKRNLLI